MTHGSLFSGIGGFDLAAEWVGWENKFHCEWNEFGQKVLKYYWPNAESLTDIKKTNFSKYENKIDVLTGGFPCQPYSMAGKRKGKEDERHLWPEMLRAIKEIQPRWIVGENVFGLVNWSGGLVFHEVQLDLENQGYTVFPYVLPAAAVNAPHRRDRVWFIAHTNSFRQQQSENEKQSNKKRINALSKFDKSNDYGAITYANSRKYAQQQKNGKNGQDINFTKFYRSQFEQFPTQSPICYGNDGLPTELDGITIPKWKNETIKAGGNAIVPQVAYQIFLTIQEFENLNLGTEETEQQ